MSQNDYHIKEGTVHGGLGPDEPTDEEKAGIRGASAVALAKLRTEIEATTAELTEKEKALEVKERELALREKKLAAAEKATRSAVKSPKTDAGDAGPDPE